MTKLTGQMPSPSTSTCILAIDSGGTFFKSALVAPGDTIIAGTRRAIPVNSQGSATEILDAYAATFDAAFASADASGHRLAAIGVSTPGPFDYSRHTSLMEHKFQAIRGLDLLRALRDLCPKIHGIPIRFIHDAHAFILGEYRGGAARGHERVIGITLGTGVGFGCVIDGSLRDNGAGGPYVSIFKKPCRDGVLEDFASRRGILRLYREQAGTAASSGIDVAEIATLALDHQDAAALAAFHQAGQALGHVLAPIINDLKADCLVFGGQISKAFPLMEASLQEALANCDSLKKICVAANMENAALIGAASTVWIK